MSASPQTISTAQFVPGQTVPKLIKTPVEGALHLAVLGVPVVPLLIRSKKCMLPGWENKSTTNITQINLWEAETPGRNYGAVAYARPGGIWILEVDSPDVLKRLSEETGKILPKTMRVRSSVGRGHIYWRHTPASIAMGNLQQSAVEHGDFSARCDAMYVVAPGGVHAVHGTQYELLSNGIPVAEAPDWLIEWLIKQKKSGTSATTTSELPKIIPAGQRNSMLASIAGSLRQAGLEQDQILEHLLKMNQERCEPPLAESEIRTIAGSISKYPNGIDERVAQIPLINGRPAGSTPVNERKIEIDTSELAPRPEFPRWIVEGTSLYEGLAKPVSDVNSKYPEMVWLPAVQLMLNYLDRRIWIEGMLLHLNLFVGLVSTAGKFFKSSSCQLGHEYFRLAGLADKFVPSMRNADGRVIIAQAGSSEGFGINMQKIRADHAVLFNDELSKLVGKATIEGSSIAGDILTWYESGDFGNNISSEKRSFQFPAGTYTFGWQFCTTQQSFNQHWATLARVTGAGSGFQDRMFFLVSPEKPKPLRPEVYVNTIDGSARTRGLINRALDRKTFTVIDPEFLRAGGQQFLEPRAMNMVYKFALYFAVDLGKDEIDEECAERAIELVKYRQAATEYLAPIEAENQQGRVQQEIVRCLRQHRGEMSYRQLCREMNSNRYGTFTWKNAYRGLIEEGMIAEFTKNDSMNRAQRWVGLIKLDD